MLIQILRRAIWVSLLNFCLGLHLAGVNDTSALILFAASPFVGLILVGGLGWWLFEPSRREKLEALNAELARRAKFDEDRRAYEAARDRDFLPPGE